MHTHPNDEATSTGGGLAVYILADVGATQTTGSRAGCAVPGVRRLHLPGQHDSATTGPADNDAPGPSWLISVEQAGPGLTALPPPHGPDVLIGDDATGSPGHRDQVRVRTLAAADLVASPAAELSLSTRGRRALAWSAQRLAEVGAGPPQMPGGRQPELRVAGEAVNADVDHTAVTHHEHVCLALCGQVQSTVFLELARPASAELTRREVCAGTRPPRGDGVLDDDLPGGRGER